MSGANEHNNISPIVIFLYSIVYYKNKNSINTYSLVIYIVVPYLHTSKIIFINYNIPPWKNAEHDLLTANYIIIIRYLHLKT